ncbi:hypothetical protein HZB88_03805 [archaeon]|nr:hypothetical protein [archaeon]
MNIKKLLGLEREDEGFNGYLEFDRFLKICNKGLEIRFRNCPDLSHSTIADLFGVVLRGLPLRRIKEY